MQNMEVIVYPKEIHIKETQTSSIRMTYKKMSINTNHELEKYENRKSYLIKNGIAFVNDEVKFKLSKQFQFHNTKIVIIVIGIKGRQISCLGDICLDLVSLKQRKNKENELYRVKIDKCKDLEAFLMFDIKFSQQKIDLNEIKQKKKQKIPETGGRNPTSQQLMKSAGKTMQFVAQTQKNTQILRNNETTKNSEKTVSKQKKQSKDSMKQNSNNGSYKKRFLYEVQRNDKSSQKSSSKEIRNNYLTSYQKDKSPSPRINTPEPITLETLKSKQTHNRTKRKVSSLELSEFQTNKNKKLDDSYELVDPETFRAHVMKNSNQNGYFQGERRQRYETQHNLQNSNISSNSLSSITNEKDNKYKMITKKLELIESKIRQTTINENQRNEIIDSFSSKNGDRQLSKSQIEQTAFRPFEKSNAKVNEFRVNSDRSKNSKLPSNGNSPIQHSDLNHSKIYLSPLSPSESACPRNQVPPSPIEVVETPSVNKKGGDEIKMSEFTINSRKSNVSELEDHHTVKTELYHSPSNPEPPLKIPQSFNQINVDRSKDDDNISIGQNINHQTGSNQPGFLQRKNSRSPQSNGKRQISPSSLSFQKRQSELKLEKKPSLGPNYLEIQVKMLQLEIQDRDMKYQKLEKKILKKQEDFANLFNQVQDSRKKIVLLSNQIIQLKTRNIELQKKIVDEEEMEKKLKEKLECISEKQNQIANLARQIEKLQQLLAKQTIKKKSVSKSQTENQQNFKKGSQQALEQKDKQIENFQSLLQTYEQEIYSLRERLSSMQNFKEKYQQSQKFNQQNLEKIQTLSKKVQQLEAQKNSSLNNSRMLESANEIKSSNIAQQNQLTQSVLQQTIQKQSLLQQSLKSLENTNKVQAEQILTLQKQKKQLLQQLSLKLLTNKEQTSINQTEKKQLEIKISSLEKEKDSLFIELKNKETQLIEKKQQKENSLLEQLQKKEKTIQKLTEVNQSLNTKLFDLQNQQHKIQLLDQQSEALIIKNAENQQLINELQQKLTAKEKQMKILKNLLRDRENSEKEKELNQQKKEQMRRQLPNQQSPSMKGGPWKNLESDLVSKSDDLSKIKVTEEGKQNFYDNYINQKAKCTNLQAQLRYAQNEIRNQKMRIEMLVQEKNSLEQQMDKIAYGNDKSFNANDKASNGIEKEKEKEKEKERQREQEREKERNKKGEEKKSSSEEQTMVESLRMENKVVQEEIQNLQSQVRELSSLLELSIEKSLKFEQFPHQEKRQQFELKEGVERQMVLARRLEAYESELRSKKNKMAEIVNAVWRGGNASLIDEIDRIMSVEV